VGFGIYHGLLGHIDKRSPDEIFREGGGQGVVWDADSS
jgi:hypothetical protein